MGEAAKRYASFLSARSINKAEVVGVMWYESRDLPAKRRAWNIRFRASRDGGETWLSSVRVADRESLFEEGARVPSTSFGDTTGLVADADGVFHAAWVDNRTGVRQIWTAAIRVATATAGRQRLRCLFRDRFWDQLTPSLRRFSEFRQISSNQSPGRDV